jgi:hypothetical protein
VAGAALACGLFAAVAVVAARTQNHDQPLDPTRDSLANARDIPEYNG